MIQEVSTDKFNELMKKSIQLGACPRCGFGGAADIMVEFRLYGKKGADCRCYFCGYETKRRMTCINISDSQRYGTPTTEKNIMEAIRQAINDWNGGISQNEN